LVAGARDLDFLDHNAVLHRRAVVVVAILPSVSEVLGVVAALLLGELIVDGLVDRATKRRTERKRADSAVECAFRDRTGQVSRRIRRWRSARAQLSPGLITFEPYLPLGVRIRRPWTSPIEIPVDSVSTRKSKERQSGSLVLQRDGVRSNEWTADDRMGTRRLH